MRLGRLTNDSASPDTVGFSFDCKCVKNVQNAEAMRLYVYLLYGSGLTANFYFALLSTEQLKS